MKVISREILWSVAFVLQGERYVVTFKESGSSLLFTSVRTTSKCLVIPDEILDRARKEIRMVRGEL